MKDEAIWHRLHRLADYPVLSALAQKRTEAQALDGRACHFIYLSSITEIDYQALSTNELSFMNALQIKLPCIEK